VQPDDIAHVLTSVESRVHELEHIHIVLVNLVLLFKHSIFGPVLGEGGRRRGSVDGEGGVFGVGLPLLRVVAEVLVYHLLKINLSSCHFC